MYGNFTASMKIITYHKLSDHQSSIVNNLSTLIEITPGNNLINGSILDEIIS